MSKVKIWGKEVSCCKECNYYNQEYDCNLIGMFLSQDIDINKDISKDCPFSKPITPEVIEGFGFKLEDEQDPHNFEKVFTGVFPKLGTIQLRYSNLIKRCIIQHPNYYRNGSGNFEGYSIMFKGIINNPIELEFILKSIGVIE